MAWFSGNLSLGNFPDLAGAVNKLSESVKNIEKNFDTALGLEEKPESSSEASGIWPVMGFIGNKSEESTDNLSEDSRSHPQSSAAEEKEAVGLDESRDSASVEAEVSREETEELTRQTDNEYSEEAGVSTVDEGSAKSEPLGADSLKAQAESGSQQLVTETHDIKVENVETSDSGNFNEEKPMEDLKSSESLHPKETKLEDVDVPKDGDSVVMLDESQVAFAVRDASTDEERIHADKNMEESSSVPAESDSNAQAGNETDHSTADSSKDGKDVADISDSSSMNAPSSNVASETVPESVSSEDNEIAEVAKMNQVVQVNEKDGEEQHQSSVLSTSNPADSAPELERMKKEMKMMEAALQGAARQAQAKADEIARLMNENEQLKSAIEDLKRRPNEAEVESLREEYHQRVATLERKVYALTKERDTLRREQNKRNDAAALLKEKDEIINQVMAEGEALSKKQAAQEAQIRKLRAQIRELEEEKKGLLTKLQVEVNKVESIKKDKEATEKLLEETIEKSQAELAAQKEFYTNALNAAREAEALAEARANDEARTALESRLKEAEEREAMLVHTLEELRQTLSRQEQQAAFREDMLRKDIEDLQKRYQASERRCEELVTQVPESTRPLLRQIEAIQEATARKAEAWTLVERTLNSRLQEAEAKAAAAEERERSINERLSQTLSRINVLEAQISCLRAEQTQLTRSLEKERQRAAENRQEYLAAKEEVDTLEGRTTQLEEEIRELRRKHKQELQDTLMQRELLQQEIEKEKAACLELERTIHAQSSAVSNQTSTPKTLPGVENGNLMRRLSSASSLGSMEEGYFLQASLDSDSQSGRRNTGETMKPYYMKSMTPSAFEATLRQKEGELASYMSRLASLEAIRDSLAEELVKMTEQCEKLRAEASLLPGVRAELEALRRRHSAALELMGERDEELEELRADIVDLKEMYREQVSLLVNQIQTIKSSSGAA